MIRFLPLVFSLALFLPAALLFNIQPMIGKMLLPLVGGTPAVWNVALAFFEIALLTGYLIAHLLGRLPAFLHGVLYLVALGGAFVFLPIALPPGWHPDMSGATSLPFSIFTVLCVSVAVPFVALSLSAPTLQRLFAATRHPAARDPYFLYAASNLGSFVGLLAYPLYLEACFSVPEQAALWRTGFGALLLVAGAAVVVQRLYARAESSADVPASSVEPSRPAPSWRDAVWWTGLAFIPSSLTLGVTQYVSTDVAPTPLLWVATLGLYLLTFILAFSPGFRTVKRLSFSVFPILAAVALSLVLCPLQGSWYELLVHVLAFGVGALACHTLLAARRPDPRFLTAFYLCVALGGALGGSFNAFLAPVLFNQFIEYPLMLAAALVVMPLRKSEFRTSLLIAVGGMAALHLGANFLHLLPATLPKNLPYFLLALTVFLSVITLPVRPLLRVGMILTLPFFSLVKPALFVGRDFFGVIRVEEKKEEALGETVRLLSHGTTTHGLQIQGASAGERSATMGYYSPRSPLATVFSVYRPHSALITGLGSGVMNCFAQPGDSFHFIEIDPLMVHVAQTLFTFLQDCPPPRITIGDGRLVAQVEQAKGARYDLIAVDAFSSDSIPLHLLTKEAVALDLSLLNTGGVLVFHVSNRFFRLAPVLGAIADELGVDSLQGVSTPGGAEGGVIHFPSVWVVMAKDPATLDPLRARPGWGPIPGKQDVHPWTDTYSNLWQVTHLTGALLPDDRPPR